MYYGAGQAIIMNCGRSIEHRTIDKVENGVVFVLPSIYALTSYTWYLDKYPDHARKPKSTRIQCPMDHYIIKEVGYVKAEGQRVGTMEEQDGTP